MPVLHAHRCRVPDAQVFGNNGPEDPANIEHCLVLPVPARFGDEVADEVAYTSKLPEQAFLSGARSLLVANTVKGHCANIEVGLARLKLSGNSRRGRHVVSAGYDHSVFVAKARREILSKRATGHHRRICEVPTRRDLRSPSYLPALKDGFLAR